MSMIDAGLIRAGKVFRGKGAVSKNRLRRVEGVDLWRRPWFRLTVWYTQSNDGGETWFSEKWLQCNIDSFRRWAAEEVEP